MAPPEPTAECPFVAVCAGSDCAKDRRAEYRSLLAALDGTPYVTTRCMGVCHGPVVVVDAPGSTPVVLERVRKGRDREGVLGLVGRASGAEQRLRPVTKGKARRKALTAADKAVRRAS